MSEPFFAVKFGDYSVFCICDDNDLAKSVDQYEALPMRDSESLRGMQDLGLAPAPTSARTSTKQLNVEALKEDEEDDDFAIPHDNTIHFDDFMTGFLQIVWPKLASAASKIIEDKMEDALEELLGGLVEKKVSFGDVAPEITEVYSYNQHKTLEDGIQLSGRLRWDAHVDVELSLGGLRCGVQRIFVEGDGCVEFRPLMDVEPVVGGFHIYFFNSPELRVEFLGIAELAQMVPGGDAATQRKIADAFKSAMVLPHRMTNRFASTQIEDMPNFRCPLPVGMLRVYLLSARNLVGADWRLLSKPTSDPYCILTLGDCERRSRTICKSLDPDWGKDEHFDFFVHHERQMLRIEVNDEDLLPPDDRLGVLESSVLDLLAVQKAEGHGSAFWQHLGLSEAVKDGGSHENCSLRLQVEFLQLHPWTPHSKPLDSSVAFDHTVVLRLKLYHLIDVPKRQADGAQVRITMEKQELYSKKCKSISPAEVCGFGTSTSAAMINLLESGVGAHQIANAFAVRTDAVQELARRSKNEPTWFGWDQAFNLVAKSPATAEVLLEIRMGRRWSPVCTVRLCELMSEGVVDGPVLYPLKEVGDGAAMGVKMELLSAVPRVPMQQ